MIGAFIAVLAATLAYVGKRWADSRTENADLRVQVATLRRQLRKQRA